MNKPTVESEIITPQKIEREEPQELEELLEQKDYKRQNAFPLSFLENIGYDDLIIVGIIVILLMEDKENRDIPLILTLAFLFLIEYIEAD
jgi:hypothetical protein